ncbi:hypothetical protein [Corynebacterium aquilae]|uniref:hypothetical protein n=1 Tax=Corynebacterium aquilae TaxID=203263 RepID=UPI001473EDA0|nr:hypothetical protein [Corynebacterium aquilae]
MFSNMSFGELVAMLPVVAVFVAVIAMVVYVIKALGDVRRDVREVKALLERQQR